VSRYYDRWAVDEARQAAEAVRIESETIREQARAAAEQARWASADAMRDFHFNWDQNTFVSYAGQSSEASSYSNALNLMGERRYEEAISRFDRVIVQKGPHADGALYHKSFCQAKLGQSNEAAATIAELKKSYPQSAYLKDARALEVDVRQLGPNQVDDEELKMIAIQSLVNQSPDQAIPLLEGVLAKSTNSLRYRRQALFVLAQIESPRARATLLSYAKGTGNPDLQKAAIERLGSRGQKTTAAELIEIYNSTTDVEIRSAVIRAFQQSGAKGPLMSIAGGYTVSGSGQGTTIAAIDPSLRARAIQNLTDLASPQELWPLYQKEENKDLRSQWVTTFTNMGAVDQLLQIAKTEKEPAVKNRAIRNLGNFKADKTGTALTEAYTGGDKDTKIAVINALGNQNNAEGLIAAFDKESDLGLRKEMLSRLIDMSKGNKVALDFLAKIIIK
jgi:HEAT repeat protein